MRKKQVSRYKRDLTNEPNKTIAELEKETIKLIRETNKRLKALERKTDLNKGVKKGKRYVRKDSYTIKRGDKTIRLKTISNETYSNMYATTRLKSRLENIPKVNINKLRIPSKARKTDLLALNKALRSFLNSKTSTRKGIKELVRESKREIRNRLDDELDEDREEKVNKLTNKQVETYYNMYKNKDFQFVINELGLTASEFQAFLEYSRSRGHSDSQFIKELEMYTGTIQDTDLKLACIELYNSLI